MATDLERLVVQLSADIKQYQNGMQQAMGVTNRQARAIENRWNQANKRMDTIGRAMASSILTPLAGIGGALGVREVLRYADAWTKAKNSLAVAGVTGRQQADVLDQLFQSAQRNSTPIGVLTDLYGKAALSADRLGASQSDLIRFADGIAVALKASGTSTEAASGALTQLGQALGAGTVRAEEFNSVLEGAPAIARAVAAGLPKVNSDIGELRQVMLDGGLASRDFFNAFLKGLPAIKILADNATQTIENGVTRVTNAFTRYVGETDESLGASQRLVAGLNALADNFGATADAALNLAAVIAGALLGRSISGLLRSLGLVSTALGSVVAGIRSAMTVAGLATAIGGLGVVAGPIGLVLGAVATALYLFADGSSEVEGKTRAANEVLRELGLIAPKTAKGVDTVTNAMDAQAKKVDELRKKLILLREERERQEAPSDPSAYVATTGRDIEDYLTRLGFVSRTMDEINEKAPKEVVDTFIALGRKAQEAGSDAGAIVRQMNAISDFQGLDEPTLRLVQALKDAVAQLDLIRQGEQKLAAQVGGMDYDAANPGEAGRETRRGYSRSPLAAFARNAPLPPEKPDDVAYAYNTGTPLKGYEKKRTPLLRSTADSRFDQDIQAIIDRTDALAQEQAMIGKSVAAQESRRLAIDLEQQALAELREEARRKGETDLASIQLAPEQVAAIQEVADAYGKQAEALAKAQQAYADANELARGFADEMVSGLLSGASAAEVLADALDNVADKILDMALDSLFDPSGGGFLANLFKGFGFSGGGAVGFAGGGYTGAGGKYQPAGVVHRGEYVFDQAAVRAAGGPGVLDAMRRGLKGYASGGFVGQAPRLPSLADAASRRNASMTVTYAPQVSIGAGASVEAVAALRKELADDRRQFAARTIRTIQDARRRNVPV